MADASFANHDNYIIPEKRLDIRCDFVTSIFVLSPNQSSLYIHKSISPLVYSPLECMRLDMAKEYYQELEVPMSNSHTIFQRSCRHSAAEWAKHLAY